MSYNTSSKGGVLYFMNEKELKRKEIIELVINKKITQKEAALKLEITDRQIRRLIIKYYDQGEIKEKLVTKKFQKNYQLKLLIFI